MRRLLSIGLAVMCVAFFIFNATVQDEVDVNKGIELLNGAVKSVEGKQYDQAIQQANDAMKIATEAGEAGTELKTNLEKLIPQLYYGKAANLVTESKFDDALKAFDEAKVQADKYNAANIKENIGEAIPKMYFAMGKNDIDAGNFEKGIESLTKVTELEPNNASAYLFIGFAALKNSDLAKAEEASAKSLELATAANDEAIMKNVKPQLTNVYLMKAQAAMKAKKWSDTYAADEKALSVDENNANGLMLKGVAAAQLKRWDNVIDTFTKLASVSKKDQSTSYYNIAVAYQNKSNAAKACEFYKKLVSDAKYKDHAEQAINQLKCK